MKLRLVLRTSKALAITVPSTRREFRADDLQVMVGPQKGKGSWGLKLEPYNKRFGNVDVTYGGSNYALLKRVRAALSALRNA